MMLRRLHWLSALALALTLTVALPAQQPVVWRTARPTTPPTPAATLGKPIAISRPPTAQATPTRPIVRAQAPDYVPPPEPVSSDTGSPGWQQSPPRPQAPPTADPLLSNTTPALPGESGVTIALTADTDPTSRTPPGTGLAPPTPPTAHTVSGPPEGAPPPPSPVPASPPEFTPGVFTDQPVAPGFWEKCKGLFSCTDAGRPGHGLGSDCAFAGMVSPVTMPFYFEDPRALTEIRPIFMYQGIPNDTPGIKGGDVIFFGTQLRLAVTDRLSFVVHELGFLSVTPDQQTANFKGGTSFAEFRIGGKYTFLRSPDTGTVMAGGVIFEIPAGGSRLFQDTGTLSIDPYLSFGQTFGQFPGGYGSLNLLMATGFSLSVNKDRSDFYYLNFHLDYNVANTNLIYPFFEANWIHYINSGNSNNFGFDGADLTNLGSMTRQGDDYVSLAGGLRYRAAENVWIGAAAEFPVTKEKGLSDYRITMDVIFRY